MVANMLSGILTLNYGSLCLICLIKLVLLNTHMMDHNIGYIGFGTVQLSYV